MAELAKKKIIRKFAIALILTLYKNMNEIPAELFVLPHQQCEHEFI